MKAAAWAILFACAGFVLQCRREIHPEETAAAAALVMNAQCNDRAQRAQASRSFATSFESISDFSGFYIVPQNYQNASSHDLKSAAQGGLVRTGTNAHAGWIFASGPNCASGINCNHRGYPTIQLHKRASGGFSGITFTEFYVNLNMTLGSGQWFSFVTLTPDASDLWTRTVLVNVGRVTGSSQNVMHLMHVPNQGENGWTYQNMTNAFPMNQWVKISICLNLNPANGEAKVWQDDVLVSSAPVRGGCGVLEQAHFGLYAHPGISSGTIYNDDLTIQEVSVCPK